MLLFVIDINGFQLGPGYPKRSAIENVLLLNRELELYNPDLLNKPCVLALNKMDLPESKEMLKSFEENIENAVLDNEEMMPEKRIEFREIIPMSAKEDMSSVHSLKDKLRLHLDEVFDDGNEEVIKELTLELEKSLKVDNKFLLWFFLMTLFCVEILYRKKIRGVYVDKFGLLHDHSVTSMPLQMFTKYE